MAGISITVLPVEDEEVTLLDAETTAPGWPRTIPAKPAPASFDDPLPKQNATKVDKPACEEGKKVAEFLKSLPSFIKEKAATFNELDAKVS